MEKAGGNPSGVYREGERGGNADDVSKAIPDVVETKGATFLWDQARRKPADWPGGNRYRGGAIPMTGSCAERGNLCCDAKGEPGGGGPAKGREPMRGPGTDGFVGAARPSKLAGARGRDFH